MVKVGVDRIKNWIFVTGVIRSGTTFLGTILSAPLQVDYIHEPFNGGYSLPEYEALKPRYVRPGLENEEDRQYHEHISRIFSYDIAMRSAQYDNDPWHIKAVKRLVGSRGPFYFRLAKVNPFHRAAVIKDPVARMVTEHLYLHFDAKPVILVKHPVSFIASLKRVHWWPEVAEFAEQPHLVADYFSDEPEFFGRSWPNRMLESAAHWRATYKVLLDQAERYPDWQVITHETLSTHPLEEFRKLFLALELPWSESVERKIRKLMLGTGSVDAQKGRVQDFNRRSSDIFAMRRDSVPRAERQAIFDIVQDVALRLYSRESFAID